MDSMEFQVTGERSPDEHTTFEFEIATLATDGSGFSGEKYFYSFGPGCVIEKEYFTSFSMSQHALLPRLHYRKGREVIWERL